MLRLLRARVTLYKFYATAACPRCGAGRERYSVPTSRRRMRGHGSHRSKERQALGGGLFFTRRWRICKTAQLSASSIVFRLSWNNVLLFACVVPTLSLLYSSQRVYGVSVSSTRRIPKLRAESQQIAAWKLLYRVQHPARYVSRLQTIPSSDIEPMVHPWSTV